MDTYVVYTFGNDNDAFTWGTERISCIRRPISLLFISTELIFFVILVPPPPFSPPRWWWSRRVKRKNNDRIIDSIVAFDVFHDTVRSIDSDDALSVPFFFPRRPVLVPVEADDDDDVDGRGFGDGKNTSIHLSYVLINSLRASYSSTFGSSKMVKSEYTSSKADRLGLTATEEDEREDIVKIKNK